MEPRESWAALAVACLIRVPSEVVKQRAQVSPSAGTFRILSHTLYHEGIQGLYRGYKSTVLREIPFSLVQFPLWEFLKDLWSWKQGHVVDSWQSAVCGAFAGGFAAAVTTPLDVAKTRIMLAKAGSTTASGNVLAALGGIWRTQGLPGLQARPLPVPCRTCSAPSTPQEGPVHVAAGKWGQGLLCTQLCTDPAGNDTFSSGTTREEDLKNTLQCFSSPACLP
ncbi:S-adenosylmethionine mitochondrial carrier protein isoform X3 [Phasianus colchicus]|uniref:S-adenosylmethionine mitochondrial carrier protein isoform X3 n=1 Tax=Phasianus colchicus TaxID=9054 RepID=UPI00129EA5E7|nr:S-adenosylmethionine mitochondrial carrier protein isoform X3 [Phasianus colchicus]